MEKFSIRRAVRGEEGIVLALLRELADYEKLLGKFHITAEVIARDYFCAQPLLHCDLAFEGGTPVGCATWYWTYHSFAARRGVFLEDLFVRPDTRGKGYGKALLSHLARTALENGGGQVEWEVLDWNQPSIEFYEGIGAKRQGGWHTYRLEGDALKKMGS
ncbi:MAG: GNAT family N-acetyltransferase [Proteobacteria bacterium]|nr:GNAT family N-acetyltransferase [Pseudomonadota bacterium]